MGDFARSAHSHAQDVTGPRAERRYHTCDHDVHVRERFVGRAGRVAQVVIYYKRIFTTDELREKTSTSPEPHRTVTVLVD